MIACICGGVGEALVGAAVVVMWVFHRVLARIVRSV
jgi:hypothetical protein